MNFDLDNVTLVQFGVGSDDGGQAFHLVAVDRTVQAALQEMASATREAMLAINENPAPYEPSEKYESTEHLALALDSELAQRLRDLHHAANLPIDNRALAEPDRVFCYFARMTDRQGRRLTALRRATQFKGVLKSRLIRLVTDALQLIADRVFKLDTDFDVLVDSQSVHILRPSGFEFIGHLQEALRASVPRNVETLRGTLPFVNFANIGEYAATHSRAARYLASIRSQRQTDNIDPALLMEQCRKTGVQVQELDGIITVEDSDVMGFLEVLDGRRYEVDLVRNAPEHYRAASRQRINR